MKIRIRILNKGLAPLWSGLEHPGGRSEAILKRKGRHLFFDIFAIPWGKTGIAVMRLKAVRTCQDKLSLDRSIEVVPLLGIDGIRIRQSYTEGWLVRRLPFWMRKLERVKGEEEE